MKENLDKDFARFLEKRPDIMRALTNGAFLPLPTQWKLLLYLFDLNHFSLNQTLDGASFQPAYEAERDLQKPLLLSAELLTGLMRSAHAANKAESTQIEMPLDNERCLVEAATAIPLLFKGEKKILLLYKRVKTPKAEVIQNYVFNGYELQRIMAHVKSFVLAEEQRSEMLGIKQKIADQQRQILRAMEKINVGKLFAIFGSVFGALQGWQALKDLFGGFKLVEVLQGLGTLMFLFFAVVVAFRLSRKDEER